MRWAGSVALVTGASRGIGRAVALAAAARGARVGLVARSRDELEAVLAACGGQGAVAAADVGDRAQVEAAVREIEVALGPVDILVANAGIGAYGGIEATDVETIERLVRINYLGTVYAMKAALPGMLARRRGHIVAVASIAGRMGAPFEAAYSATKFAVVGLCEAAAIELAPRGVRVSIVNPGPVATDFFEARGHPYARRSPRPIRPERVARAVIDAVERDRLEVFVPRWLRLALVSRVLAPPLYEAGTRRAFRDELARA
jgi:short-subunit dehydrogenase